MTAADDCTLRAPQRREEISGPVPVSKNDDGLFQRQPRHGPRKRRGSPRPGPGAAGAAGADGPAPPPRPEPGPEVLEMDDEHVDYYI